MDPKMIKKTQDTLGKIIKKPPLTEKLLSKPPFRFLHDIVTSVVKTTGFMQGLFTEGEMNSENVKDKDTKCAFLQKEIDFVSAVLGKNLSAKPAKIVAGHEPEKTNELLQCLADAINKNVDNDEYVRRVLKGGGGGSAKEEKKEKDRTKSADRRKSRDPEDKHEEKREKDRERRRDKGDKERKHDKEDKDRRHDKDRDKDRKERHKDRERDGEKESTKSRDKSRDGRDREERHRDRDRSRKRDQSGEKENESPATNGEREEKQETPARLARPASAKGSRRRREEDEEFHQPAAQDHQPVMGEDALPPQVAAARLARPSSARPAPPRPKQEAVESEPAMRLGTGQPANLIVDNGNEDDDEDLNFLVEESAPAPEPTMTLSKPQEEEDEDHGALVKKMLESKKELEGGSINQQTGPNKKTEIERPVMSDAQRRKQREIVQKEVEKLRGSIQGLTRSANPLGKVMDYVQEDLDSMQQELDKWKTENTQHALDLKRETSVTDRAIEPLRQQLTELERTLGDQLDQIAAVKANIIRNDVKISKMLRGIAGS